MKCNVQELRTSEFVIVCFHDLHPAQFMSGVVIFSLMTNLSLLTSDFITSLDEWLQCYAESGVVAILDKNHAKWMDSFFISLHLWNHWWKNEALPQSPTGRRRTGKKDSAAMIFFHRANSGNGPGDESPACSLLALVLHQNVSMLFAN